MSVSGGYTYQATLTFQPPQHASGSAISQCTYNPTTDAELVGTLTVTNETNFSGEPGVSIEPNGSADVTSTNADSCDNSGTGYGFNETATSPLSQGQSFTNTIYVIIPNFYTPDHPNGDPASVRNQTIGIFYYDQDTQTTANGGSITGPGEGPGTDGISLAGATGVS